jgi:exodeoxyribonuclease VII small subunit
MNATEEKYMNSLEEMISRLEEIKAIIENDQNLPIDRLVSLTEEAMHLKKACKNEVELLRKKLDQFMQKSED